MFSERLTEHHMCGKRTLGAQREQSWYGSACVEVRAAGFADELQSLCGAGYSGLEGLVEKNRGRGALCWGWREDLRLGHHTSDR